MKYLIPLIVLVLGGCATGINTGNYNVRSDDYTAFSICHGYGCHYKSMTGFSVKEWRSITAIFQFHAAKTPEAERSKIAKSIAVMEALTGAKTGTSADLKEAAHARDNIYQMDCIDETVNTSQYLAMLQKAGFLKFYGVAEPTHRGYFIDARWPHNTAVMMDIKTGALWAVDSYYRANGQEPYIMPRQDWLDGWRPVGAGE